MRDDQRTIENIQHEGRRPKERVKATKESGGGGASEEGEGSGSEEDTVRYKASLLPDVLAWRRLEKHVNRSRINGEVIE